MKLGLFWWFEAFVFYNYLPCGNLGVFIKGVCLLVCNVQFVVGWRVGVWLSDPKFGSEETPPTSRIAVPQGTRREPWQRSRNETSTQTGRETFVMSSVLGWKR